MDPERDELEVAIARLLAVAGLAHERQAQLQEALESRVVIEQAKGILAERHGVSLEDAFRGLRRGARSSQVPLRELALEVTTTRDTPAAVASALPA